MDARALVTVLDILNICDQNTFFLFLYIILSKNRSETFKNQLV